MNRDAAETMAFEAVAFVMGEDGLRDRFVALSGSGPDDMVAALSAGDAAFLRGVLEFLLGHEPDLMAFCDRAGLAPEAPMRAYIALGGTPT